VLSDVLNVVTFISLTEEMNHFHLLDALIAVYYCIGSFCDKH
jgi:hypothetical protein